MGWAHQEEAVHGLPGLNVVQRPSVVFLQNRLKVKRFENVETYMEYMDFDLLRCLIQARLCEAAVEPRHGSRGHGCLSIPTPLEAAQSSGAGLTGHGAGAVAG